MLKVTIIAVGKLTEKFWQQACDEYLKRLRPYATIHIIEIADAPESLGIDQVLAREGEAIIRAFPERSHTVLLDRSGKSLTSEQTAQWLESTATSGTSHVTFVIGGSHGVSAQVRQACTSEQSFGPITLPHNLARVVLLEQLYRAIKINRGEPYHK